MESAQTLVHNYIDRFNIIFPTRGDPYYLDGTIWERQDKLMEIIDQYNKIGQIYERLGIVSDNDEDDK